VNAAPPSFTCGICLDDAMVADAVTFDCEHRFCSLCVRNYLTSKIVDGHINGICCPDVGCDITLPAVLVGAQVPPELRERYFDALAANTPALQGECHVQCPKDCGCIFAVPDDFPLPVGCPRCRHEFCRLCKSVAHEGSSCEQHRQWRLANDSAEASFEEYRKQHSVQQCPSCSHACELMEGCKFAHCTGRCQSMFCILCGISLAASQHHSHFFNEPYGDRCRGPKDSLK